MLVVALVVVGVLVLAQPPRSLADLLSPVSFQDAGQAPTVLIRLGVLFFCLDALRRRWPAAVVVIALFVLSLAVRGALYPFVLVAGAVTARADVTGRTANAVLLGSTSVAIAALLVPRLVTVQAPPDERDPAAMVAYWRARQNPYQARWWAIVWAKQEADRPGNGLLALATLNWELERKPQARRMLTKLLDQPVSDDVRARAEAERAKWDAAEAAP